MDLIYDFKNRSLLFVGAVAVGVFAFLLTQLGVFADSTGSLLPSSDDMYLQWTPSTGSTHYTLVDESTCNGTTDYNSTNTVGSRDLYGVSLASVPNGSTITAIEITPCASRNKGGHGSATMNVFYRFSGADSSDAGNYALTGTIPTQLSATTFSGLSLVKGSASTLQIGAVLSAGTKGARLSRIAVVVTYTPLAAPSNLTATPFSQSRIDLSWTDNSSNEDGFKVERSTVSASGPWAEIASTTANVVSYSSTGLNANTTYWYQVRAFNSAGNSGYSNVASAATLPNAPAAPSNLTAATSSNNVILNWVDNAGNEDGFKIERRIATSSFSEIASVGADVTTHTDLNLPANTYGYRVRAFSTGGFSSYSNIASTTVP